ncbi:MAG TPA: VWA domain-containing protein [Candidatus Heimdallarchaeota archaeon]|nr:VWA domain-containing protein [Candidatus Heimdallarchaeota archaeon]
MNVSPRAIRTLISVVVGILIAVAGLLAFAESVTYSGVTFPDGDLSFADRVVAFCAASCVRGAFGNPEAALGPPDCGGIGCTGCFACDPCAVALGYRVSPIDDRGYLILEFVDNRLTDVPGNDLFVYVTNGRPGLAEISSDGIHFVHVGEVRDYPSAIDISPFVSSGEEFRFVRITDVPADEDRTTCAGTSIDSVGAMGPVVAVAVERGVSFGVLEVLPLGELAIAAQQPAENLLFVLDTSTSMDESFEDATKLDVAKRILLELVDTTPNGIQVGFRSFGGCGRSKLLVPIGPLNRTEMKTQIQGLLSGGATPLAYVIEKAREDFAEVAGSKVLVLVSDGMETCQGDPIAAARSLVAGGYDLRVQVVGYDVAQYQAAREQLKKIAEVSGGMYCDASDSEQLRRALQIAGPVRYTVYNEQGESIFVGVLGEPGPRLPAGLYDVIFETTPPLELMGVAIRAEQKTTITLRRSDGSIIPEVQ